MTFSDQFYNTGEVNLHYLEGPPNGPPLVLIHGASGSVGDWGAVQAALTGSWHVYNLGLRGHGLSGHGDGVEGYHAAHFISDTLAFLRDVVGAPAVIWGHSWGAVVTLLGAGQAGPNLRAMVLEDPPVMVRRPFGPESSPFQGYFGWALQLKEETGSLEGITAALRQANPDLPEPMLQGFAHSLHQLDADFLRMVLRGPEIVAGIDFAEAIRAANVPALVMQADPNLGAALVAEDLDLLLANNPAFQLVEFPGSGHGIHHDQYERAMEVFRDFTARLP
jgi:pimeloyl-ACP methyl ester carboxylesterase